MIPKSGNRFSDKIMLKTKNLGGFLVLDFQVLEALVLFVDREQIESRSAGPSS